MVSLLPSCIYSYALLTLSYVTILLEYLNLLCNFIPNSQILHLYFASNLLIAFMPKNFADKIDMSPMTAIVIVLTSAKVAGLLCGLLYGQIHYAYHSPRLYHWLTFASTFLLHID